MKDAISMLNALFTGGPLPACLKTADSNDDSLTDISDGIHLLAFLFTGGSAPPPPAATCGTDPTPDQLDCAVYRPCE